MRSEISGNSGEDAAGEPSGEHGADGRHQAEDDAARRTALRRLQVVADLLDLADQPGGAVEQHPAGAGQQHAAAVAHEQFDAQLVLEQLDVPAQRGLCGSQPVGRLAEAAELGHGPERAQLLEVHPPTLDALAAGFKSNGVAIRHGRGAMMLLIRAQHYQSRNRPS